MSKIQMKCPTCGLDFTTHEKVERGGLLSGIAVVDRAFCSSPCQKRFKLTIALNDLFEEMDKVDKQIARRIKSKETKKKLKSSKKKQ